MDEQVAETDLVLSAIRRGEDTLPKLKAATGLNYSKLQLVLYQLEFVWSSVENHEDANGSAHYYPRKSERTETKPARDDLWALQRRLPVKTPAQATTERTETQQRIIDGLRAEARGTGQTTNRRSAEYYSDQPKENRKMQKQQIDFDEVEKLASEGVAISVIGVKLGMSDGYGSYQAKTNPEFLAAFNRGRATANLEPFQPRKSPGASSNGRPAATNGRKNGKSAGARTKAKTNPAPSLSELPTANGVPINQSYALVIADLRRQQAEMEQLIQSLESRMGV